MQEGPTYGHTSISNEEWARLRADAASYRWLRERDLGAIDEGGVFAGLTPDNLVLNGEDLDREIDAAMSFNR